MIEIEPDRMGMHEKVNNVWSDPLHVNEVESELEAWYDVYIKADGPVVEMWRAKRGLEAMQKVLWCGQGGNPDATFLDNAYLRFGFNTGGDYRIDDIRAAAAGLTSTVVHAYSNANELANTSSGDQGTTTFGYDAWGRMTHKQINAFYTQYFYRYGSKLYQVTTNSQTDVTYEYRGDEKRHSRTAGSDVTVYNWDAGWGPVSEEDGSGTLERTYIGGLGHADGTNPATGAFTHYMHDHLGSVRGAYGQGGAALGAMEHDPYGGAYFDGLPPGLTHRYTGHQWDGASALYYAPYRYYAPAAGRWLTRDPLGMVDGPNVYAYVRGNPVMFTDPEGTFIVFPDERTRGRLHDILDDVFDLDSLWAAIFRFKRKIVVCPPGILSKCWEQCRQKMINKPWFCHIRPRTCIPTGFCIRTGKIKYTYRCILEWI